MGESGSKNNRAIGVEVAKGWFCPLARAYNIKGVILGLRVKWKWRVKTNMAQISPEMAVGAILIVKTYKLSS